MDAREYYAQPAIRERIAEFLGGDSIETATCAFVAHGAVGASRRIFPQPPHEIGLLLDRGLDIARSSWDKESILLHLDIEYVNFDHPAQPYLDHRRTFELQEPAMKVLVQFLAGFGIRPLHLLSGRGHHLVWRVPRNSIPYHRLAGIGRVPYGVESYYAKNPALPGMVVDPELARAYAGVGMVLEFVTDTIIETATPKSEIPLTISDVEVEPRLHDRETISIDVSEYSDPLNTRMIRTAFSVYSKAIQFKDDGNRLELLHFIPRNGMDIDEALPIMHSPEQACRLAQRTSVAIPNCPDETERLISAYEGSPLAQFHKSFYSIEQERPSQWPRTYDRESFEEMPPCLRVLLAKPGKELLRPAALQVVVRALYALGWHPQHISGLVRSKFERGNQWGDEWSFYNPATRADFYVRAFSGAIALGYDRFEDFSCESLGRKGFRLHEPETCDLSRLRGAALQRRIP